MGKSCRAVAKCFGLTNLLIMCGHTCFAHRSWTGHLPQLACRWPEGLVALLLILAFDTDVVAAVAWATGRAAEKPLYLLYAICCMTEPPVSCLTLHKLPTEPLVMLLPICVSLAEL